MRSLILFLIAMTTTAHAETVRLAATDVPPSQLEDHVARILQRLAQSPGSDHKILLSGRFRPAQPIRISWFADAPLTITAHASGALLDGAAIADNKETLFLAGRQITLSGLRFANSQGHAVVVGGNSDQYTIADCRFSDCRQSAIHVWNDPHTIDRESSRRGWITGNTIQAFNLAKAKWANDGITVFDQRVLIAGNVIRDSATETNGIRAMGRDLTIERNRIEGVSIDDSGGIYLWGGPHASTFRGNMVRGNHVIGASRGIYLDDGTSGATVVENVIQHSSVCGIFISGGRDNRVIRNVVDGAPVFLHLDSRCLGWDSRPEFRRQVEQSIARLKAVLLDPADGAWFQQRYRGLSSLQATELATELYGRPQDNTVRGNFVRDVDSPWELMDFARDVTTDFPRCNSLQPPQSFEFAEPLTNVSFKSRFHFEGFDRLPNHQP